MTLPSLSKDKLLPITIASLIVLLIALRSSIRPDAPNTKEQSTPHIQATLAEGLYTVTQAPLSKFIRTTGTINAGKQSVVSAPFAGRTLERFFEFGQKVDTGSPLLQLDTDELQSKAREAEVAELQAKEKLCDLQQWTHGSAVAKARRSLEEARTSMQIARSELESSKDLYELGLLPLQRVRSDERTFLVAQNSFQSAEENLRSVWREGSGDKLKIVELQYENAHLKAEKLRQQLASALIRSPNNGIISKPENASSATLEPGSELKEGNPIAVVQDLSHIRVRCLVPEIDIHAIALNQPASITGDGFRGLSLEGTITHIDHQAQSNAFSNTTQFAIEVTSRELEEHERQRIQLGMSANVTIESDCQDAAITIPLNTLEISSDGVFVYRTDPLNPKRATRTSITPGTTQVDSIEVLAGLTPGDQLQFLR